MKVVLTRTLSVFDPLLQNLLGFFDKLAVQIDCVRINSSDSIVLAKDKVRSLLVVLIGLCAMRLCFLGQLMCGGSITTLVSLA